MDQVAILIAAPGSRAIDDRVIDTLRAGGSGPLRWLAPGEAVADLRADALAAGRGITARRRGLGA